MFRTHLLLSVLCFGLLVACSSQPKEGADPGGEEAAAPVQVIAATSETIHHIITAEAVLYPVNQANIMPKISAPVQRFFVNRGDHVRQGQVLAVLENHDLAAAANESKGTYEQMEATYRTTTSATMPEDLTKAQTDVLSARQALEAANKVYESRLALFRDGALARKLVDDAKVAQVLAQSQFETAKQHLQSVQNVSRTEQVKIAQAQVDAAKAHYENSEAQLSYAEIRSPINGVVSDRPLYPGEMASSGSAIVSVVDISQVIARANIPVHEAAAIRIGRQATISGPGGELSGKVTVVSPAVDPSTTTVQVWVQAANTEERLKPGITVRISVDAEEIPKSIVVPNVAILSADDGSDKVMVAGSDSLAHERKVELGVREGDKVQVVSGLKEGEQVITVGGLGLDDKAKIQVQEPGKEDAEDAKKK
jgi:multidrug efflux pump subunit AcrA (membrane-fusion protein)